MGHAGAGGLQGMVATREDERALAEALERAFDYRGDVTIETVGGETIEGYLFDRRRGEGLDDSLVRVMPVAPPEESPQKREIRFSEIAAVRFTGRDMAHGKSFETWVKKFTERKLAEARAAGYVE